MVAMESSSALQPDRCCLHLAVPAPRRCLLRMLPPRAPPLSLLSHRRGAVRFSTGDRGGGGGSVGVVEKRSVPVPEKRGEEEEEGLVAVAADGGKLELRWPSWEGATSLAFVICNMDKVNLSVAIVPMSHQYGWNSSTAGLVQSSFFWGYALSQLPGGLGGKIDWWKVCLGTVFKVGVLAWSLAAAVIPAVAGFMPGLVLSRILVGIGEGVSPSAATDLIARYDAFLFRWTEIQVWNIHGLLICRWGAAASAEDSR